LENSSIVQPISNEGWTSLKLSDVIMLVVPFMRVIINVIGIGINYSMPIGFFLD
jgi:hypothetical protein